MKKLLVAALFAASTVTMPTLLVVTPAAAATCSEDVPVEWKRPGGYCDQLEGTDSLAEPVKGPVDHCAYLWELIQSLPVGEKILVAC